jgi:methyl-accepting chemotaxis protein
MERIPRITDRSEATPNFIIDKINSIVDRVNEISRVVDQGEATPNNIIEKIDTLTNRVNEIENTIEELRSRIYNLENSDIPRWQR